MGWQIDQLPHHTENCNTQKALKVFEHEDGTIDGFCFACKTFIKHPYGEAVLVGDLKQPSKKKTKEQIEAEIAEVFTYPTKEVGSRKLRAELLSSFGAKTSLSEWDGVTPTAIYWPVTKDSEFVGFYVKNLDGANPFFLGNTKDSDLINWVDAKISGAYKLIITEGPEDMASVRRFYQMYGKKDDKGEDLYPPAVVSLPRGASSAKSVLTKHSKEITSLFKEVILCFDNDKPGQDAVKDAMLVLPSAKSVVLPYKDANECLVKGAAKAAYTQLSFRSETPKNTRIVYASTLHEKGREPAQYGELTWPWLKLQEATRGLRLGETGYFGSGVKMGKGEVRNALIAHFIEHDKRKVFVASFEETNVNTYKRIAGKLVGKFFHDPKKDFDFKAYDKAGEIIKDNLFLLNLYQHADWKNLKLDVLQAIDQGVEIVFIDPITNLTNGIDPSSTNTMLQDFAQDLSSMALDHRFFAGIFCHLKAPEGTISSDQRSKSYSNKHYIGLGNCSHEWGGNVYSNQFAGSRAMMRSCNFMMGIEGNKDPDLPDEIRNVRHLKLLEEREFGEVGVFPVYWNNETGLFKEC